MKLLQFIIEVEANTGVDTRDVCINLVEMAKRLGCCIKCDINGVMTYAYPGDSPEHLHHAWSKALRSDDKIKLAFALGGKDKTHVD